MACGRRKIEFHCDQSSTMLPAASTTTRQCSQRASTPTLPSQPGHGSDCGLPQGISAPPSPGKAATGPCEALRNGTSFTGKERLGPKLGMGVFFILVMAGSLPRCRMKTRFGFLAKMPATAPQVHFSCPGKEVSGFGQSG